MKLKNGKNLSMPLSSLKDVRKYYILKKKTLRTIEPSNKLFLKTDV